MSAYSALVIADGATFYWRLGESAGTTAVDAKGILDGVYTGAFILGQTGALTGSGDTDKSVEIQTTGLVVVPADTRHYSALVWTLEAWVYPTAAASASKDAGIVLSSYTGYPIPFVLAYGTVEGAQSSGKRLWTGFYGAPWNKCVDPTDLSQSVWTHVAGSWDGTTLRLYRNGVQVASVAGSGQQANVANPLLIGRNWGNDYSFPGRIDEAAFYQTVLAPSQLLSHYTTGATAPSGPTVQAGTDWAAVLATL